MKIKGFYFLSEGCDPRLSRQVWLVIVLCYSHPLKKSNPLSIFNFFSSVGSVLQEMRVWCVKTAQCVLPFPTGSVAWVLKNGT
jgi:hypothetical protein